MVRTRGQDSLQGSEEPVVPLARQTGHQVQMDDDAGLLAEPLDRGEEPLRVGFSPDPPENRRVARLDADLEPEEPLGDSPEEPELIVGEELRGDLEVKPARPVPAEDELPDRQGPLRVVVEGPVHELHRRHLPCHEESEVAPDPLHPPGADAPVQGGEAEGAGEGTAAGGLHVDEGLGEIDESGAEG